MAHNRPTPLLRTYSCIANLLAPFAFKHIKKKLIAHGTDPDRIQERLGHPTVTRPDGRLVWLHAASVGESLSVLRLIEHMGLNQPDLSFLLTSGTATSADIIARRLPPRCQHQFAPLDGRRAVRRFLNHWHPDAAIFVESELWPNMLIETDRRDIPLVLINARISDRSAKNWKRFPKTACHLMNLFKEIHTQDARTTAHLHDLGLEHAKTGRNLKSVSGPLPFNKMTFEDLRTMLGNRPLWVASSTHTGEEEIILAAHRDLLETYEDLLLILVPRHPERGDEVAKTISVHDLTYNRRTTNDMPDTQTQVYLADTLGETGLWYALSPIVFLGGSFAPVGGHNPFEPAYAGAVVVHGPLYVNFAKAYAEFAVVGGAIEVLDAPTLTKAVSRLLSDPDHLADLRTKSSVFAHAQENMLDELTEMLFQALSLR